MKTPFKTASLLALPLLACGSANAALSMTIGLNADGGLRVINESTSATLTSIAISFDNGTFFDTTAAAPGINFEAFSQTANAGSPVVSLPNNNTANGNTTTTLVFSNAGSGSDVSVGYDLDLGDDSAGDVAGSLLDVAVTVTFDTPTGARVVQFFPEAAPTDVGGEGFDEIIFIPEPSSLALAALGMLGLVRRRRM